MLRLLGPDWRRAMDGPLLIQPRDIYGAARARRAINEIWSKLGQDGQDDGQG